MTNATSILFSIYGVGITLTDIASIATAISVIVGIIQLWQGKRIRTEEARRNSVKEAVEIAKVFQQDLIKGISYIRSVYRETNLIEYINEKIPKDKPLRFSSEEADAFCGESCVDALNRFENAVTVEVLDKSAFMTPGFMLEAVHVVQSEEADQLSAIDLRNKTVSYYKMRDDIMNKLEWSAMLLNSKVADKKAATPHQLPLPPHS